MGAQDELRERFKKGLTESQINMVEELKDIQFDITQIELEHWFYHGFCLGAKVIMEICLEPTTEKPIPTWLLEHLRKVEIT